MKLAIALTTILLLVGCQGRPGPEPLPAGGLPAACYAKPEAGKCRAALPRYYHQPDTGTCERFLWGGCEGRVPFETRSACEIACGMTTPVADDRLLGSD